MDAFLEEHPEYHQNAMLIAAVKGLNMERAVSHLDKALTLLNTSGLRALMAASPLRTASGRAILLKAANEAQLLQPLNSEEETAEEPRQTSASLSISRCTQTLDSICLRLIAGEAVTVKELWWRTVLQVVFPEATSLVRAPEGLSMFDAVLELCALALVRGCFSCPEWCQDGECADGSVISIGSLCSPSERIVQNADVHAEPVNTTKEQERSTKVFRRNEPTRPERSSSLSETSSESYTPRSTAEPKDGQKYPNSQVIISPALIIRTRGRPSAHTSHVLSPYPLSLSALQQQVQGLPMIDRIFIGLALESLLPHVFIEKLLPQLPQSHKARCLTRHVLAVWRQLPRQRFMAKVAQSLLCTTEPAGRISLIHLLREDAATHDFIIAFLEECFRYPLSVQPMYMAFLHILKLIDLSPCTRFCALCAWLRFFVVTRQVAKFCELFDSIQANIEDLRTLLDKNDLLLLDAEMCLYKSVMSLYRAQNTLEDVKVAASAMTSPNPLARHTVSEMMAALGG